MSNAGAYGGFGLGRGTKLGLDGEVLPAAGGGSGAARLLGPFPFAFNTAGINNGVSFYTPTVGDLILDIWVSVTTVFNGTTPQLDIGTYTSGTTGFLTGAYGGSGVDLTVVDVAFPGNLGLVFPGQEGNVGNTPRSLSAAQVGAAQQAQTGIQPWQARVTVANPLKVVVSQDGMQGGTAIGGTTGAGNIYLIVATPVSS